jgi:CheY-like chemotaxis protein
VTATEEIRKDARFKALPIVAMTANSMQSDRERCMAAGMNDHVAKPIEPEDLWKALLKWIKPRHLIETTNLAAVKTQDILLPSGIDGLDISNGLRRVLGKKSLYLSMLRKFVVAMRLAHTLKGVSGNIGATDLQLMAEKLEIAIKERDPREEVNGLLDVLTEPLENLIAQLEQQLPEEQIKTPVVPHQEKLKNICFRLEKLLADDDAEASEVWESNTDIFNAAFPDQFRKIDEAIRSFNFEAALAILKTTNEIKV